MANFIGLGKDCVDFAKICIANNNKQDVALFVMTQDKIIHNGMIEERVNQQNQPAVQNTAQQGSSDRRQKALERLKAHL